MYDNFIFCTTYFLSIVNAIQHYMLFPLPAISLSPPPCQPHTLVLRGVGYSVCAPIIFWLCNRLGPINSDHIQDQISDEFRLPIAIFSIINRDGQLGKIKLNLIKIILLMTNVRGRCWIGTLNNPIDW